MAKPQVDTAYVQGLIREMTVGARLPSGADVRRALASRFGSRGGVARIYRILAGERARLNSTPPPERTAAFQKEIAELLARAELAEERERAHQQHWATEIDRLRMRIKDLEPLANQGRRDRDGTELLKHQLRAAEQKVSELEELLLANGSGTVRLHVP
jgi:hypothetical protein